MKKFKILIAILIGIITIIFVYNDDFLYKNEIMKITKVETISVDSETNDLGIIEKYYHKKIYGIITNGKNKNKKREILYEDTYSQVVTDRYRVLDKVIVKGSNIEGLKRDTYVAILLIAFIVLIYIVGNIEGLLSICSVIFNLIIFYIGLDFYFRGSNILLICVIQSLIFSVSSLFIAGGINKKTISAIVSVVTSTIIILMGLLIIVKVTNYKGINFNELSFLTVQVEDIILPELLIGMLGASMDVSITMSSAIDELIEKDKNISVKNLKKSSKQIGKDIMSTMTNVLFFTYLCSGLPIFVLATRNGFSIYNYITTNFSLELTRFLVGSIGIIMTIPIATFISIRVFKRGEC